MCLCFFFKQKTAYEMRISDWSSDVCSSDLARRAAGRVPGMADLPVHLIETSPALRAEQRQRIPDAIWHDDVSTLPDDHALLVIANEFFDALPVDRKSVV